MPSYFRKCNFPLIFLVLIPICIAIWVWISPLAFIPVPWPDDSAFYFVAKDFFKWPPRWVMTSQAPFEPTYRIFNFNTMPLYPLLIGLGRFVGIDGTFLLKFWPLSAWALSGSLLLAAIYRRKLPFLICALIGFAFALDPELRWASVLVRPESLIGLSGMALVLGLTLGFPDRFKPKKLWDPVAALLAIAAYAHFNAIHLIFPVIIAFFPKQPRRLVEIATKTILYLSPWILTVVLHWNLFIHQMTTQWDRLAIPNDWLSSPAKAISSLFQALGSPEPWPTVLNWTSIGLWIVLVYAVFFELLIPFIRYGIQWWLSSEKTRSPRLEEINLKPAAAWIVGAVWIFDSKPEVWFIYYLHVALWCFIGLCALKLWQSKDHYRLSFQIALTGLVAFTSIIFGYVDLTQASRMQKTQSWNWNTYDDFVNCIDRRLARLEENLGSIKPFRVWGPTFPDVTIELSRKHPLWEFTRTNDFMKRSALAVQHGLEAEAVVVTETLGWEERTISAEPSTVPQVQSLWMNWKPYYLNQLWTTPGWKPNRYVCQRGRWQAFIFMKDEPAIPRTEKTESQKR
jgi:hypothetical protein